MRTAFYARRSTDLQNPRSTEDQVAALRVVGAARQWAEARVFTDDGLSGSTRSNRPSLNALLEAAERGEFDLVVAEALDRLSRDQEDTAYIYKRLSFHGVRLETLSEGVITPLHVGMTGTMNQIFLEELAKKTRRGLIGRVKAGYSGGGRCYGYRIADKGVLEVDDHQASIIQRIYKAYAGGASPRVIAHRLNAEGEPGPRGGEWTPSTINGDRRAQDGILHQELYIGVRVFNRRRYRRHPDTGRRSSVLNPPEEWLREPVPDLRIVDDATWNAVQDRKKALADKPAAYARKPKRLLSGLMKCALCGSGMTLNGAKYACSAARERGTCENNKIIAARTVEQRVLAGVRQHLLSPQAIAEAVRSFQEEQANRRLQAIAARAPAERELAEIGRKLERGQMMFMEELITMDELKARTAPLVARRNELEALIATSPSPVVVQLHPGAAEGYRRLAENLHLAVEGDDGEDLRRELRKLIEGVEFVPLEGLGKFELIVRGQLAGLLQMDPKAQNGKNPAASGSGVFEGPHRCEVLVGAGAGFEPATFRL